MTNDIAIQVEHLSKCYRLYEKPSHRLMESIHPFGRKYHRDFFALNDISFSVERGETLGIIGRNGTGKSTLLKVLSGVLTPTSGSVSVKGRISSLLELGAGFNPELSGMENIYLQGTLTGHSRSDMGEKIPDILAFADIGDFIHQPVKCYSSGMFVRLAFACAIHVEPDILIIDEALAVGDIRFQVKCQYKMAEFSEKGKTVILVSHSGSDIVRLCERVIWLDQGGVKRIGPAKAIVEEYHAWMVHNAQMLAPHVEGVGADARESGVRLVPIPASAIITGEGGAAITSIGFFSAEDDRQLLSTVGKAMAVKLVFRVLATADIQTPGFSFQIINEKGLRVMGSNTTVQGKVVEPIAAGQRVEVSFSFFFPEIENGAYLVAPGVVDGDNTSPTHVRCQYIADAYQFSVLTASPFQKQAVLLKLPDCSAELEHIGESNAG